MRRTFRLFSAANYFEKARRRIAHASAKEVIEIISNTELKNEQIILLQREKMSAFMQQRAECNEIFEIEIKKRFFKKVINMRTKNDFILNNDPVCHLTHFDFYAGLECIQKNEFAKAVLHFD